MTALDNYIDEMQNGLDVHDDGTEKTNKTKRYYWLKLPVDFFRQKEIKKLRRIPGGDTYTIIYQKMLLLSLSNEGRLYYEGVEDDFATELAYDIDEDVEAVKITVQFLMANKILFQNNVTEYELMTAHEMVGSETDAARRMRKMRNSRAISNSDIRLLN